MSLVVNTNVAALNAQRNLAKSGLQLGRALERLSSGLRINNASDDAAGLAISTRLGAQVRGLNQAIRNANDGAALLQTAEGALSEITNIVTRIKELAVQSANGTNSTSDRGSLDAEVQSLVAEVTRIATQTKFGSTALLDGSFSGTFQVGVEVAQTVSTSVASFRASNLAGDVASQALTFEQGVNLTTGAANANSYVGVNSSTALQISGPTGITFIRETVAGDDTASHIENSASAIATAKAINEFTSVTGVSATVTSAVYTVANDAERFDALDIDGTTNTLRINGQSVVVNLNGGTQAARRQQFIDAVNSQVSGVVAAVGDGDGGYTLTAVDGRNISVQTSAGVADGDVAEELFGFTGSAPSAAAVVVARGGITLQAGGTITSVFANAAQVTGEGTTAASPTALSSVSVATEANANTALLVLDAILDAISEARGDLGAVQNRLASTVANLSVVAEKVSEARSRILDADFAMETAALTRAQILQQAGIAILAQANAVPQAALLLLR